MLLVNKNNTLPIRPEWTRIALAGRGADDLGMQAGGWTITWQGNLGKPTDGTTVLGALKKEKGTITHFKPGEKISGGDVAIVVIGEPPYAEMKGDRQELSLDPADIAAVKAAKAAGMPVVVVLFSGRPLILEPILNDVDALIAAWLPGSEGEGITDVLFGRYNPTGKLSVTWPRTMAQIPINVTPKGQKPQGALFDYGFGLSYAQPAR